MPSEWLASIGNHGLSIDDVHIWRAGLSYPPERADYPAAVLSKDENARADRFHFVQDRTRFILTRAILRILLGQYLAISPIEVIFTYNQYGKPILSDGINRMGLQFNLSHSQDLALYVFTRNQPAGIDLEYQHPLPDLQELAARCFSRAELEKWEHLPPTQQEERFFLCWTQKEACLKATGYGLHKPLTSVEADVDETEVGVHKEITEHSSEGTRKWSALSFVPAHGYVASLVTPNPHSKLIFRDYTPS